MKSGTFVKFKSVTAIPTAQMSKDGCVVGIFHNASKCPITREPIPEAVFPMTATGENVTLVEDGQVKRLGIAPSSIAELLLAERADLPEARCGNLLPDWVNPG